MDRRGKKILLISVGIFAAFIGGLMLFSYLISKDGPFGESIAYNDIIEYPSTGGTFFYMKNFPDGKRIEEVMRIDDSLEYFDALKHTQEINEADDYKCRPILNYINNHRKNKWTDVAKKDAEQCMQYQIEKLGNRMLLAEFIKLFPDSKLTENMLAEQNRKLDSVINVYKKVYYPVVKNRQNGDFFISMLEKCKKSAEPLTVFVSYNFSDNLKNEFVHNNYAVLDGISEDEYTPQAVATIESSTLMFSETVFDTMLKLSLQEKFDALLGGRRMINFITQKNNVVPETDYQLVINCKVGTLNKISAQKDTLPCVMPYYETNYHTKTVTETKTTSEYNKILKRWETKTEKIEKTELDYSRPYNTKVGYFFLYTMDYNCELANNESKVRVSFSTFSKPDVLQYLVSTNYKTVYEGMYNEANAVMANALLRSFGYVK